MSNRRRFLRTLAALGLLEPTHLIRAALAKGDNPHMQGLRKMSGDVRVNGQPAIPGMIVRAGDTVTTGKDGEAIYVIGKDAFLQRAGSSVNFATDALRVISGKLLSVFGKGNKQIRVPTATIGIRGTGCYIEANGEGTAARTYFCLCYGTADLTPHAAPQQRETIVTQHHDHPIYIYNDPTMTQSMVGAEVMNHTDLELTMLEALVGRLPPFGSKSYPGKY